MEEITQSRAQDTLVREVGSRVGPGDPHHQLETPEGGAGGGFVLQHIEDDIREDCPGHGVAGWVSWSCLTGLLCLRYIRVRPPVRSLSLHTTGVYHQFYISTERCIGLTTVGLMISRQPCACSIHLRTIPVHWLTRRAARNLTPTSLLQDTTRGNITRKPSLGSPSHERKVMGTSSQEQLKYVDSWKEAWHGQIIKNIIYSSGIRNILLQFTILLLLEKDDLTYPGVVENFPGRAEQVHS